MVACPRMELHNAVEIACEFPSSLAARKSTKILDEMCSAMAWNTQTGAIFALENIDLPLVDTSIALEAASGDIVSLVRI